jgi:hypothetical protein
VALILTAIGLVLLVTSLAGVALGLYMAVDRTTREDGWLFAVLWVPGLATASGVLMRDIVTFTVGVLCLLAAGTVFVLRGDTSKAEREHTPTRRPAAARLLNSEDTTKENRTGSSDKAAS